MRKRKPILFPASLVYGLFIKLRNFAFEKELLKEHYFDNVFIIGIGNLSVGGTGKTPLTEYFIRMFSGKYKVAVLSRGYGRKTEGYREVQTNDSHLEVGDEALQIKLKHPEINVILQEKRVLGVQNIITKYPETQIILLDDSYQHRYIKTDLNILLTDYFNLFTEDFLLPAGNLREHRKSSKRADAIIVTKCDKIISPLTVRDLKDRIKPKDTQILLSSYIDYLPIKPLYKNSKYKLDLEGYTTALCFSGIANKYRFNIKMKSIFNSVEIIEFKDHHNYKIQDIINIIKRYTDIFANKKYIITTEKDAMRLQSKEIKEILQDYPIFYLPIECKFHAYSKIALEELINKKLKIKI